MTPDSYTIREQMLSVGDGHELYVHEWGNKQANHTFLFLHGGPGSGCNDSHKALFDGERDHVIFFDQRGAGKSVPGGSFTANTTNHLIGDIELILEACKVRQATLVGGSWGACLALAYGLAHPERVTAMVLRGIFTGSQTEIDYLDKGTFRLFYPEVWDAFLARTPKARRADPTAYHISRATTQDTAAATDGAYAYSELEGSIISLDDRHKPADRATFNPNNTRIETHYTKNGCFMEDRYILKNAHKLQMPVWLVQGRYDMVCPPVTAYELHRSLPNSELIFTVSGHAGSDRGNFDTMRSVIRTLAR
jgi:proline iminopeptidase